jgi:hypothetical protein
VTEEQIVAEVVALVKADPACPGAADQLQAAARDGRPMDDAQERALGIVVGVTIAHAVEALGITPEALPAVLDGLARTYQDEP